MGSWPEVDEKLMSSCCGAYKPMLQQDGPFNGHHILLLLIITLCHGIAAISQQAREQHLKAAPLPAFVQPNGMHLEMLVPLHGHLPSPPAGQTSREGSLGSPSATMLEMVTLT